MENPRSLPNCPTRMYSETPFRKPTRMGLERKSATAPSRRKLAPMQKRPASVVMVMVSDS
jgi:hypothetical protein